MRSIYYLLIPSLILFVSCRKAEKNIEDYYPVVKMISATVTTDGALLLTAEIESTGLAEIDGAGFCMDTIGNPTMLENQILSNQNDGKTFSVKYKGLDPKKKYYFRCFAANQYGYKYGDVLVVNAFSLLGAQASCSPTANSYSIGLSSSESSYISVSPLTKTSFGWAATASTNSNLYVTVTFGSKPTTKVYTAVANSAPTADQVAVQLNFGFNSTYINPGHGVYVKEISSETFEITICDAPWQTGNSSIVYYFTTKFQTNL